jgi:ankyrin repeat protein
LRSITGFLVGSDERMNRIGRPCLRCCRGHAEAVELLLRYKVVDTNIKNENGKTAEDTAIKKNKFNVLRESRNFSPSESQKECIISMK